MEKRDSDWVFFPGATVGFIVSLTVSLWLNLRSFLEPVSHYSELPISVDRCMSTYMNVMNTDKFVSPAPQAWARPEKFAVQHVSYLWYTAISVLITFLVAVPVSFLTGANNPRTMDPKLAARPFDVLCPWLSKEARKKLSFGLGEDFVS